MKTLKHVQKYRDAVHNLKEWKKKEFPNRTKVSVFRDNPTNIIYGEVNNFDHMCPLDKLAVKLCNGNTWWFPLENCKKV